MPTPMIDGKPDLRRLSHLPTSEDPHHLAPLFLSAKAAPERDLPRLRWRLRVSLQQRATRTRRFLKIAVTAGTLFVAGGVLGSVIGWNLKNPTRAQEPKAEVARPSTRHPAHKRDVVASTEPGQAAATPAPAEALPTAAPDTSKPVAGPSPVRSPGARASAPASAPAIAPPVRLPLALPASSIVVEHALLGDALRSLRNQHAPGRALELLDEHGRRFPSSVLAPERAMLRAEALLGLGRNQDALSELDRAPLGSIPHQEDRLLLRGELRATAGRWREAGEDFQAALALVPGHAVKERALWGRASARSHLGDFEGARADLAAYLREFPSGRFATQARPLLEGTR
jgi:hypothetical protein